MVRQGLWKGRVRASKEEGQGHGDLCHLMTLGSWLGSSLGPLQMQPPELGNP